jgi:hypothetical protein
LSKNKHKFEGVLTSSTKVKVRRLSIRLVSCDDACYIADNNRRKQIRKSRAFCLRMMRHVTSGQCVVKDVQCDATNSRPVFLQHDFPICRKFSLIFFSGKSGQFFIVRSKYHHAGKTFIYQHVCVLIIADKIMCFHFLVAFFYI